MFTTNKPAVETYPIPENGSVPYPAAEPANLPGMEYYYDLHPTKEDLMGESIAQDVITEYLRKIFRWQFRTPNWFIGRNLNLYQTNRRKEKPLAPDLAIFIGVVFSKKLLKLRSWRIGRDHFPPRVVFEFASNEQWDKDVETKPGRYARMGVSEVFTYDPRPASPSGRQTHRGAGPVRLRGWTCREGQAQEMVPDEEGWLWSEALESWLVPLDQELQVHDANQQRRINRAEAAEAAKEVERAAKEQERAAKEQERAAKERERAAKEQERAAKERALAAVEVERAAKEMEQAAKERERDAKERAWTKLREAGIDPESL